MGIGYYQVDPSGLHFPDMYDNAGGVANSNNYVAQTSILYDFAAGAIMSFRRYYGGIAVHHILEPTEFDTEVGQFVLPRRITIHVYGIEEAHDVIKRSMDDYTKRFSNLESMLYL